MMSDENRLDQAAAKARRAQELLDNELLTEAFSALEENYTAAWRATTVDDVSGREKLFLAINIVGKVRERLSAIVANGKLAQAELKELAQIAERRSRHNPKERIDKVLVLFKSWRESRARAVESLMVCYASARVNARCIKAAVQEVDRRHVYDGEVKASRFLSIAGFISWMRPSQRFSGGRSWPLFSPVFALLYMLYL